MTDSSAPVSSLYQQLQTDLIMTIYFPRDSERYKKIVPGVEIGEAKEKSMAIRASDLPGGAIPMEVHGLGAANRS